MRESGVVAVCVSYVFQPSVNHISHSSPTMAHLRRSSARGQRLIIHTEEERFPRASSLLMRGAFPLLLLNMTFGLLPSTLHGTRLTYARCSLAQLYALGFGLAILILSALFVPVLLTEELRKETSGVGVAVVVLTKLTHVVGFLLLLVRGHWVARGMVEVWTATGRLVHRIGHLRRKSLVRLGIYTTAAYVFLMTAFQLDVFQGQLMETLPAFHAMYGLRPAPTLTAFASAGYVLWALCSFSHVLVSALATFILSAVLCALKALNALLPIPRPLLLTPPLPSARHSLPWTTAAALARDVFLLAEEVIGALSSTLGVSLIIEVLILIANMLVDIFYILVNVRPPPSSPDNSTLSSAEKSLVDEGGLTFSPGSGRHSAFRLIIEAAIHFLFFYQLCCVASNVVNEGKRTLQILKTLRPCDVKGRRAWRAVVDAKGDLGTADLGLTAANYFRVNKFLLTSVTGALTTYIIVLLQFAQDGV